jgi:protein SCO1/2
MVSNVSFPALMKGMIALIFCAIEFAPAAEPGGKVAKYEVRGIVERVDAKGSKVMVAHEAIRGYMDAMTMEFRARDSKELAGIGAGDRISFQLLVGEKSGWIESVRKLGEGSTRRTSATIAAAPPEATSRQLKPGDIVPECVIRDQQGELVRLSSLRGQALVLSFIFTRCPFPEFCPRMSSNLQEAQKELLASQPARKWKLISVSIDPEFDTPERLRAYAGQYGADEWRWIFATGDPTEIERLAGSFGLAMYGKGATLQHNLRTVVVNPEGRVQHVFIGNEWRPSELVAEVKSAMKVDQE